MTGRVTIFAGLVLAGLLSGCAGDSGAAPDVVETDKADGQWQTAGCDTPAAARGSGVDALVNQVQEAGKKQFASVFAGVEVIPDKAEAIVYRRPSAEFDAYLRENAGTQCVQVRDAAHTETELMTLVDRIAADMAYWRSQGITINTVGPRHDGSGVEVGTQQIAAARIQLPGRYGPAVPIVVVEQGPISAVPPATT